MIIFNQVNKQGLQDLSFTIDRGEFVYLYNQEFDSIQLLRRLMTGLEKPESGLIRWYNYCNYTTEPVQSDLGIVFRDNILLADRTLQENFQFIMNLRGSKRSYIKPRINKVINVVGLERYLQKRPDSLCAHQLVRANIGQALLHYPSILILEDPTEKLDQVNSQGIIHLLKKINRLSTTVILLSCDQGLVLRDNIKKIRLQAHRGHKKEGFYA